MRIKFDLIISILIAVCIFFVVSSCKKDNVENIPSVSDPLSPPAMQGDASLKITLAANQSLKSTTTYDAVYVEILQISYHSSADTNISGGWNDLETIPGIYNLMDYVVDDTLIAFDTLVNAQTISQLRLVLGDSNTVMIDSVMFDLQTPSAQSSGLKLQVHTQMIPDSAYVIMLDFDPEQSVKQLGNNKYKLRPVIRTIINP